MSTPSGVPDNTEGRQNLHGPPPFFAANVPASQGHPMWLPPTQGGYFQPTVPSAPYKGM